MIGVRIQAPRILDTTTAIRTARIRTPTHVHSDRNRSELDEPNAFLLQFAVVWSIFVTNEQTKEAYV